MCISDPKEVKTVKIAKPAASPPSPVEAPTAPEPSEAASLQHKSTAKGKLALRSDVSTPEATGLNVFK